MSKTLRQSPIAHWLALNVGFCVWLSASFRQLNLRKSMGHLQLTTGNLSGQDQGPYVARYVPGVAEKRAYWTPLMV